MIPRRSRRFTALFVGVLIASGVVGEDLAGQTATPGTGRITGRVIEASSLRPLAGAQVVVVGSRNATLVRPDGQFALMNVAPGPQQVSVSIIGFSTTVQSVNVAADDVAVVNFELSAAAIDLDEIIVTGTAGAARRREIGNTISAINAEELAMLPISSTEDALRSGVTGLNISQNDGSVGAGGAIRIRGVNSISQGNRPIVYVDGVRIWSDGSRTSTGYMNARQSYSPLNDIAPQDIARIEVVKGAAATTLYGTEASGGVIQIFTHSGSSGERARWQASVTQGIDQMPTIKNAAAQSEAWFAAYGPESNELWIRDFLRNGQYQNYYLSVDGGMGDTRYFVSGSADRQEGVIAPNALNSYRVRGNVGFSPIEDFFVQFNNSFSSNRINHILSGNAAESFGINVMRGPRGYGLNPAEHEAQRILDEIQLVDRQNHFTSGFELRFQPTLDWTNRLALGLDYIDQDYTATEEFGGFFHPQGVRVATRWQSMTRTADLATTYSRPLSRSISTSSSLGFQLTENTNLTIIAQSESFPGPSLPTVNTGAIRSGSEERLSVINAGFFFQETLGFNDKIFLTGGLRVDGNSAFGEDFGLQPYPKVSLAYTISDEPFWPSLLESTKLRAAYGESGKAPGYFDASRVWLPVAAAGLSAVSPSNIGNPELGPERTKEIEVGLEASALNGRLGVDLTHYRQTVDGALVDVLQDPTLGFTESQLRNVGVLRNTGFEIDVTAIPVITDRFNWSTTLTLATNEGRPISLGDETEIHLGGGTTLNPMQYLRVGYPGPAHFATKLLNPDEIGAPIVEEDAYIGPVYPTRNIHLSSELAIGRNLTLNATGEWAGGHYHQSATYYRNLQREIWPPCFDIAQQIRTNGVEGLTAEQRFRCNLPETSWPGSAIFPADFFKLRTAGIHYSLPRNMLGMPGSWSMSLTGRNLFTSTKFGGLDPETSDGTPGGTRGSDTLVRVEYYNLPPTRSFRLQLRAQF